MSNIHREIIPSWVVTYVVALVLVQVGVKVALVGAVDGSRHAGPRLLESQDTLHVVTVDLLAGDGVNDRGLDAEEWEGRRTGLGRGDTGERSNDVRASLGLPVGLCYVQSAN